MKLGLEVAIEFVIFITLLFRLAAVVNSNLLVRVVQLPGLALILLVEVHDEERVLEVDEEVAHVGHLLGLLLVRDDVDVPEHVAVGLVDLVLQLLLVVSTRDVFDAKVGAKIEGLLDAIYLHRRSLSVALALVGVVRAAVLRSIRTLVATLVVGVGSVGEVEIVREMIVATDVSSNAVQTADASLRNVFTSCRLCVLDPEFVPIDGALQGSHKGWRAIQGCNEGVLLVAGATTARVEVVIHWRGKGGITVAVLHRILHVIIQATGTVIWLTRRRLLVRTRIKQSWRHSSLVRAILGVS